MFITLRRRFNIDRLGKDEGLTKTHFFAMVFGLKNDIPTPLKQLATRLAIALFRAIRWLKRALQTVLGVFVVALFPIGYLLVRGLVLPLYRLGILLRLKFQRIALPTRGLALFVVTNKYLFHTALGLATLATIIINLDARQVLAQDVGKSSLLYALATNSDVEIVQESSREEPTTPNANYLGRATLAAIPHIDFDYDEETDDIASIFVPGSISAPPSMETPEGSKAPRTRTETYVVQDGDTIASIAHTFNVNVGTILWSNNLTERQYIRPGDSLKIPPVSGILVTIKKGDTIAKLANRYSGNTEQIKEYNRIVDETTLALGTEIVIPDGKPPLPEQTIIAIRGRAREQATAPAAKNVPKPKAANTAAIPSTKLLWPTPGRVVTQYYGWRHTGLDIDGDFTSPLYASYDGVVQMAGWNSGGYGLQIVVKHPNGLTTRYAHASKLFVKVGDSVKRGEVIAMMGSTGRSTGSHLHFEVYVGNRRQNPLAYIR